MTVIVLCLFLSAVGLSAVCDCGISWPYSLLEIAIALHHLGVLTKIKSPRGFNARVISPSYLLYCNDSVAMTVSFFHTMN